MESTPSVTASSGMANVPSDTLRENLIDRAHLAEECACAAHMLIDRFVAKHGSGFVSADKSKGQLGVVASLEFLDAERLDIEMNYLFKSFVFSAKASLDRGFHTLHVARDIVQPGKQANTFPDPSASGRFNRFIGGVLQDQYPAFHPILKAYYAKWAETIIHLRLIRNTVKQFGKAHLEINMGRPCWKFLLSKKSLEDESLKFSPTFMAGAKGGTVTLTLAFLESVIACELDHLLALAQVMDVTAESGGFIDTARVDRLLRLVHSFEEKVAHYQLGLLPAS
jgi:hypothetical protein